MSKVGAVVVTYNTPPDTVRRCQDSLRAAGVRDISLVRNTPADNPGFASSANRGAGRLRNDYLLFINPDAVLAPASLAAAQQHLTHHARAGAVGFLLVSPDGRAETYSFGPSVTPVSLITRHLAKPDVPRRPTPVGWTSGGALMIRRRLFERLGGFDPRFFMYWEDVDLCRRLRQAGWQVVLVPQAKAIHSRGASLTDKGRKTQLYDESADKYFCKHYPAMICFLTRWSRFLYRFFSPRAR